MTLLLLFSFAREPLVDVMKLRKRKTTDIELGGQDSFLDLVSNIIGILIILVMVAGIQAQYSSANISEAPSSFATPQILADLETKRQELQTKSETTAKLRHDAEEVLLQSEIVMQQIHRQTLEYSALFDMMTSARAAIEIAAEERSQTFKEKIEYQRRLQEINAQLEQIDRVKTALRQMRPKASVLENIPTPLAKTVEEKEIHFRLLGGKIVYVPFTELLEQLRHYVGEEQNRLAKTRTNAGKVGPIESFDLEFSLETLDVSAYGGYGAKRIQLQYAEVVPKLDSMGETIQSALASPQSEFRRKLSLFMKNIYTVTVWVYPDSFEEYQELKRFLREQGYSVAARPTTMDQPIAASPFGTKSSAQ